MQYRKFGTTGELVSALGFGTMRLPLLYGGQGSSSYGEDQIDVQKSIGCIRSAIDQGVNYIDTAYNYMGRNSEAIVGKALQGGYRQRTYLATKSPTWLLRTAGDFDRILDEQLKKLQTEQIDMYLLHSLTDAYYREIVRPLGVLESLKQAKADGRVRYIGFSFHDELPVFRELLDAADWDFCQIQLNYVDTEHQAGLAGLRDAAERGLGVSIMEPLRGGYLVHPPEEVAQAIEKHGKSPVEFALDFVWDRPEVSTVLSGMCSEEQLSQNILYADRAGIGAMTKSEHETAAYAKQRIFAHNQIGCTGCRYCEQGCPKGVPISAVLKKYYDYTNSNDDQAKNEYRELRGAYGANGADCIACGKCEAICPQHIKIPKWLTKTDRLLR